MRLWTVQDSKDDLDNQSVIGQAWSREGFLVRKEKHGNFTFQYNILALEIYNLGLSMTTLYSIL